MLIQIWNSLELMAQMVYIRSNLRLELFGVARQLLCMVSAKELTFEYTDDSSMYKHMRGYQGGSGRPGA